jgi:hypothetical protein
VGVRAELAVGRVGCFLLELSSPAVLFPSGIDNRRSLLYFGFSHSHLRYNVYLHVCDHERHRIKLHWFGARLVASYNGITLNALQALATPINHVYHPCVFATRIAFVRANHVAALVGLPHGTPSHVRNIAPVGATSALVNVHTSHCGHWISFVALFAHAKLIPTVHARIGSATIVAVAGTRNALTGTIGIGGKARLALAPIALDQVTERDLVGWTRHARVSQTHVVATLVAAGIARPALVPPAPIELGAFVNVGTAEHGIPFVSGQALATSGPMPPKRVVASRTGFV